MKFFDWAQFWKVAGPFVIAAITAFILFIICMVFFFTAPKGLIRELVRIASIVVIVIGFGVALYISAGIWGYPITTKW